MADGTRTARTPLIALGALLIAAGAALGIALEADSHLLELDAHWSRWILTTRGPVGDAVAFTFDAIGGGIIGIAVVPLLIAVVLLVRRRYRALLVYVCASLASGLVVQLMKHLFARERPAHMLVISDFGSFPSGHTANAATAAAVLVFFVRRAWATVLATIYVLLMAVCRTYVGAHWFTDTVGGALVGTGVAVMVCAIATGRGISAEHP
ncbi:phosphatase PAP2 family protein [Gryllotalpicola protaetiae]|uniref:Phosphatase PAP2 family protein n=1 Tax=Gryllotalpicola protaetiae TaxID=2419771 RepID=A0A387BSS5_9MICO|nr:phosphatase PAP2 family protein [Gryllotalpicola protaetiae]AYG03997.1 phosphatase PAP2 family protein [Gryllotalpicola protaetiae]